jgi:glutamate-1-semialdehyde 2,1-aminomutase
MAKVGQNKKIGGRPLPTNSTTTSQEYFERALAVAPGGVHSPVRAFKSVGGTPVFFKSAKGATLTSVEGKEYIDFCMSFGPLILGHRDPEVQEEVLRMIHTAWTFGACEPYSLELAEWITQEIPWLEKVRFVSSGTEAVMSSLRVARAATGKHKIIKFEGCYHGHSDSLLVKAGSGLAGVAASDSAGVSEKVASETLVAQLNDIAGLEKIFADNKNEVAAVIIEPLPANYGLLIQHKQFLEQLKDVCKKHSALLIFDEVISGFRVALGGMAELTGVVPDLVCYGKIMGGGFPVGCYGGKKEYMDLVAPNGPVYQAGTLSGNPVGMVAGLTTLKKAKRENVWQQLATKTETFTGQLQALMNKEGVELNIAQYPSLFWIHGNRNVQNPNSLGQITKDHIELFKKLFHTCLEEGIYLAPSGFEVSFLSWAHTDQVLDEALIRFTKALKKARE